MYVIRFPEGTYLLVRGGLTPPKWRKITDPAKASQWHDTTSAAIHAERRLGLRPTDFAVVEVPS